MIVRIWRTGVDPDRVEEYERFARTSGRAAVITLWEDMHSIETGVLEGDQVVEIFEDHGFHVEPGVFSR